MAQSTRSQRLRARRKVDALIAEESPLVEQIDWVEEVVPESSEQSKFAFDVAIVGLGYVGLPTALNFFAAGSRVLGVDVSERRLAVIREQRADLLETDRERLARALEEPGAFTITSDLSRLSDAAAVIVAVPTPVDPYLVPDLDILRSACDAVVANAVPGQLLMVTSTTYVGSTRDMVGLPLQERGMVAGVDVHVAFSPERINPGSDVFAHEDVPRVVGGATASCGEAAAALLKISTKLVHVVPSMEAAEMTKLVENTFRAVNIALANEFADICQTLGMEVMDVIEAASTKPYGFMAFTPGPGVGGHCIPCDPHYLLWQLRRERLATPLIETAMSSIAARPRHVVDRARRILSDRDHAMHGARVLVVGVAYKPDVEDLRESPALEILEELASEGVQVGFHDPLFESLRLPNGHVMEAVDDPVAFDADLVILHTAHSAVDHSWLQSIPVVLDTTYRLANHPNIVRL